jgi:hypothetical protein
MMNVAYLNWMISGASRRLTKAKDSLSKTTDDQERALLIIDIENLERSIELYSEMMEDAKLYQYKF